MLNENGIFAAQIPLFEEMPANQCIVKAEEIQKHPIADIAVSHYV